MNQIKRPSDDLVDENNNSKKFKSLNEPFIQPKKSHLEDLPNEIIYQIFGYLGIYDIYSAFFSYNNRFQNLILHSNSSLQIHVPNISKIDFQFYCSNVILPNQRRINYLHLSNPFTFNQLFYPPHTMAQFQQLETLILENINIKYLSHSFRYLSTFKHLHSLHISFANTIQYPNDIFRYIFNLSSLKTCRLTFQTKYDQQPFPINLYQYEKSPIEKFVLNARLQVESFRDLMLCLPKLRYLSLDCLVGSDLTVLNSSMVALKDLRYVSIKLDGLSFLHLTQLAKSNCFSSSKHWFFTHQHDNRVQEKPAMMLYSTEPYRRKDFSIYGETYRRYNQSIIPYDSVKYLEIFSKQRTDFSYYFPNVIELKLGSHFSSIVDIVNQILPLKQLQILQIAHWNFPFEDLIHLLYLAPNLHTLKLLWLSFYQTDLSVLEQNPYFQSIIQNNQIKSFHLNQFCTLDMLKIIFKLFPRIEDLKIEIYTREIEEILRYLFPKTNRPNHRLKCLCLTRTPKRCLKELDNFIKSQNLLKTYSIKLLNRQLYLWW